MKTLFTSISLLVIFSVTAFGLSAEIAFPEIGHRAGIDKIQEEKVNGVLAYMQNDLKFIEGRFINEFSTQRFGGTSSKASRFIALLTEVGLWDVQVGFRDFGEQESALTIHQNSSDSVLVTINSGRDDFLLKDFGGYLSPGGLSKEGTRTAVPGKPDQTAIDSKSKSLDKVKPKLEAKERPQ
jgi:hypothetical protein